MWKDQIVSDLFKINVVNSEDIQYVSRTLSLLKQVIPNAHSFYVGELGIAEQLMQKFEINRESMLEEYNYEYIKFPYDLSLWCYDVEYGGPSKKEAVFVANDKNKIALVPFGYSEKQRGWLPSLHFCLLHKNKKGSMEVVCPGGYTQTEKEEAEEGSRRMVSYVLCFLKILSCKNVKTEEIKPKITRQMKRHNIKAGYSYHILTVTTPNKTCKPSSNTSEYHNRVHFCRGHFKEFFPDNPLFGKYTGLYWWQPHLRGRNKTGFIDKEYHIVNNRGNDNV